MAATTTGYENPVLPYAPGATAGNGVAIVGIQKYSSGTTFLGTRALRWTSSGAAATELGLLGTSTGGYTECTPYAINNAGTIIGFATKYVNGLDNRLIGKHAVRWDSAGTPTELGHLGTDSDGKANSIAHAINPSGIAIGVSNRYVNGANKGQRPVRWDPTGTAAIELGNLGMSAEGNSTATPWAINAAGTIVGVATKYTGSGVGTRAARWDANGAITELGYFAPDGGVYPSLTVRGVDGRGTAIGIGARYIGGQSKGDRAVRWDASGTAATELGILGTDADGVSYSRTYAINPAGVAVGTVTRWVDGKDKGERPVRWDPTGTAAIELGNLGLSPNNGGVDGAAFAINATGVAAGYADVYDSTGPWHAVVWGVDGTAHDLNGLLSTTDRASWNLTQTDGISDTFWATGLGTFDPDRTGPLKSYTRAFLIDVISVVGTRGDANRDARVNFADLLTLAQNYGVASGANWDRGDFDGNGKVNFADLLGLAQNYAPAPPSSNAAFTTAFASDWTLAQSIVPEPVTISMGAALLIAGTRRGRQPRAD